jgi:UDP-N-acetylmuramoylalanine--D-glutamate ligase
MTDLTMLSGLHSLVVGLGREGQALATYLAAHDLTVTATDKQSPAQLESTRAALAEAGVALVLGEHPLSLLDEVDLIFVSPGVPLEIPFLQEARARQIPLSTESRLFCQLCPAPIIGITGSNGKTTTTTLVGEMLKAAGHQTWVGGNIGQPLIAQLAHIQATDRVVMELSSFQLEYFRGQLNQEVAVSQIPTADLAQLSTLLAGWSPPLSAILNITPNHLDRHPSMKEYVRAKRAIIDYQEPEDVIILSLDDDMTRTIGQHLGDRVRWFSLEAEVEGGAGLKQEKLVLFDKTGHPTQLADRHQIKLRGDHNVRNMLAACLLAREAGAGVEAMRSVITSFRGVAHRLELVRVHQQVAYYDDSIATSPERLIAALESFEEPLVLLAGGYDKHLPWEEAARWIVHKSHEVILFGADAPLIAEAIAQLRPELAVDTPPVVHRCDTLEQAVQRAAEVARPGDVVLLSPGCASFDAFRNFAERGDRFKALVSQL